MHLEVASENDAALALYRSLDFQPSGRRKRYYPNGADAVVLTRPV
jgi:ribosomal-protein-alanine N-acetyltransferase